MIILYYSYSGQAVSKSNSSKYFTAARRALLLISYYKLLQVDLASYPNCDKCPNGCGTLPAKNKNFKTTVLKLSLAYVWLVQPIYLALHTEVY